jgi:hypothetical protein
LANLESSGESHSCSLALPVKNVFEFGLPKKVSVALHAEEQVRIATNSSYLLLCLPKNDI